MDGIDPFFCPVPQASHRVQSMAGAVGSFSRRVEGVKRGQSMCFLADTCLPGRAAASLHQRSRHRQRVLSAARPQCPGGPDTPSLCPWICQPEAESSVQVWKSLSPMEKQSHEMKVVWVLRWLCGTSYPFASGSEKEALKCLTTETSVLFVTVG